MDTVTEKMHTSLESCVIQDFKNVHNISVAIAAQKLFRPKANPRKFFGKIAIKCPIFGLFGGVG